MLAARGDRAHEDLLVGERVHADAVAEQRAAGAAARRIDRDHGDLPVREVPHEARQQLVAEARLAGAAGAGDADHRRLVLRAPERAADLVRFLRGLALAVRAFEHGDRRRDAPVVANVQRAELVVRLARGAHALHHVLDHRHEAHVPAVLGRVDLLDAVLLQHLDLVRGDRAAAADEHADVLAALLLEHVDHVLEVLVVAALVGADRDAVGIFLDGRAHDVGHAAVVAEVHHLGAARLQQPAHHVDGRVVAVEQRRCRHEAQHAATRRGGLLSQGRSLLSHGSLIHCHGSLCHGGGGRLV